VIPFIVSFSCLSQQIIEIDFEGITKTKHSYLQQFLTISEGDILDSTELFLTKQRLANLEMLSDASFTVEEISGNYKVVFQCQELFTLLPIFSFGGIEENFWIQVGASEVNLAGRGNKLTTYYQYYDRSSFAAHLTFDRIRRSNWGVNINFIKWSTLEPLFFSERTIEYAYDNYTFGVNAIRHLNFTDRIEFGGAFFTEDYAKNTPGSFEGIPEQVSTMKILGKTIFVWNHINYHFFYLDGWHNQLNIETVQSLDGDPSFYIAFNDIKKYWRNGTKGNIATRLRLGLSTNEESPFAPFVLDSYLNIRGVGNRVDRGTGAIILNAEYRHTFFDRQNIAIQGVAFSDTGSWRNPGGNFTDFSNDDNFVLFAGGGGRFIHKKIFYAILRVDYGFNLQEPSINGFVLGIGQYF
ncbi:MAG: outer membrane protein assembly factor, partial [Bacteroidota bacterium]